MRRAQRILPESSYRRTSPTGPTAGIHRQQLTGILIVAPTGTVATSKSFHLRHAMAVTKLGATRARSRVPRHACRRDARAGPRVDTSSRRYQGRLRCGATRRGPTRLRRRSAPARAGARHPLAVQAVPDSAQHWRRTGWRVAATETANERIDSGGHRPIPRNRLTAARLTRSARACRLRCDHRRRAGAERT